VSDGKVVLVPSSAVVKLEGIDAVFVATPAGFELRDVQIRSTGSGSWIVLSGLVAGDRVAVTGTAVLKGMSLGMGGGDE
jgi:cobalt-zinc-cadmium efflux system membrane fusion protein